MGIARPPDPYGMTAPPAWPDVDEDILRGCRDAFDTVLKTVTTQWEAAKRERPQMFEGAGIWSGGAADAAHKALRERIADLESVKDKLQASVDLFNNCVKEIVDAKNQIIDIVDIAHNLIDKIQNDPNIEDKAAAIQAIVNAARAANIAIVAEAGAAISGKPPSIGETPTPPGNGIQLFVPACLNLRPLSLSPMRRVPEVWVTDNGPPGPSVAPQPVIEPVANAPALRERSGGPRSRACSRRLLPQGPVI